MSRQCRQKPVRCTCAYAHGPRAVSLVAQRLSGYCGRWMPATTLVGHALRSGAFHSMAPRKNAVQFRRMTSFPAVQGRRCAPPSLVREAHVRERSEKDIALPISQSEPAPPEHRSSDVRPGTTPSVKSQRDHDPTRM
ncbi:hypothetical protein KC329_g107 [Hortaea werneckii]|nr:hypothetical protein KC329_g107 [Hortaea werneckii]